MPVLMILVSGPNRAGTNDDPTLIQWFALPLIEHAGSTRDGGTTFTEIFQPVSRHVDLSIDERHPRRELTAAHFF